MLWQVVVGDGHSPQVPEVDIQGKEKNTSKRFGKIANLLFTGSRRDRQGNSVPGLPDGGGMGGGRVRQ